MGRAKEPVTLSAEQIHDLHGKLRTMRHDINNHLSLIVAAAELIRYKPDMIERMSATLIEQPPKITAEMAKFSSELERLLGVAP